MTTNSAHDMNEPRTDLFSLTHLTACSLCGSSDLRVGGQYLMQVPGHPLSGSVWRLSRCGQCGLTFVNPRPKNQIFGGFAPDADSDYQQSRLWRRRLRTLEALVGPGRLLDVGPGAGAFLHFAQRGGWDSQGVDVQPKVAAEAQRRSGVAVYIGEIDDPAIMAQRFDAVTMWDVLEHVQSVSDTLAAAASILRPGGVLALSTINAGSLNATLFGPRWAFWNRPGTVPEHLQAFRRHTLLEAVHRAGFDPSRTHSTFMPGALIEPVARSLAIEKRVGPRLARVRASVGGRVAAAAVWKGLQILGWPVGAAGLGDVIELYAVRLATNRSPGVTPPMKSRK